MKVLVFGRGFLGERIARTLPGATLHAADIADEAAVRAALDEHAPDAVVNAAGKTGRPNVDWCETHQTETFRSNVEGPLVLARVCQDRETYLLHLASGCVFYGASPAPGGWREDDFGNPTSFYSRTKYAADLVLSRLPGVGIARLRMPVDSAPGPRNLITKLAGYKQVIDVVNSVTVVDDLVQVLPGLVERRAEGIYHVTNPGTLKHRDLLALYRELVDPAHDVELIADEDLVARGLALKGRSNCILSSARLDALGLTMRPIDVALRDVMTKYARAVGR
ncbi:MAG: sugar nucleotide-binding protein [Labilithrix sp.]|nr:sugar nucleotide-binding protein [Labilithrix sp.]